MEPVVTLAAVVLGGVLSGTVGWVLAKVEVRRSHRLEYLLGAYSAMQRTANRPLTPERAAALEDAIDQVFLLGDAEQVKLAGQFRSEFQSASSASLDPLLVSLRRSLRQQLGLTADEVPSVPSIRFTFPDQSESA